VCKDSIPDSPALQLFGQPKVDKFDVVLLPILQHDILIQEACPLCKLKNYSTIEKKVCEV
jgi:hypothetical protein